jgi:4-carboxymuconolactone decarboxylase
VVALPHPVPDFGHASPRVGVDVTMELIDTKKLSDSTYARALDMFGEKALIELIAILGNYFAVALVLNTFEIMPPDGSKPMPD